MRVDLHIGLDDTDAPTGGCTTYTAALLLDALQRLGCEPADYPRLVRLNPNIPWKTRGNAAVALHLRVEPERLEKVKQETVELVERASPLAHPRTNPGIVFLQGEIPPEAARFAELALTDTVSPHLAVKRLRALGAEGVAYKGPRGLVGALAAAVYPFDGDFTFEAIAYRAPRHRGTPRRVDPASVFRLDRETAPYTFNNLDEETGRILITPRGPDPILFGVRGESPEVLRRALNIVKAHEPIERMLIFKTNQGTDAHLTRRYVITQLRPHIPAIVEGRVASTPRTEAGGHVLFELRDESGAVRCAAYEPTGRFRHLVRQLAPGDLVRAYGGVRKATAIHPRVINLEKLEILATAEIVAYENPRCPACGKRMESLGRAKGFRCPRCRFQSRDAAKVKVLLKRQIAPGLYIPPPRANRHLTKPPRRYGLEKDRLTPSCEHPNPILGTN